MADASLTGLRAVRPRGPRIFLGVLALTIAAGLSWWFFVRPAGPIGAAEDAGKLLVVGDESAQVAGRTLGDLGFSVTAMTLADAESKAREAVGPDLAGPHAALRWADHEGIGYVAFAEPASLTFGDLEVTSDSAAVTHVHRWVVFSVGDLGMPHKATVGRGDTSLVELPLWVELMRAVFEQDRPASTLFAESQLPMDAVELHEKIQSAVELQAAYGALDVKAKRLARERDERLVKAETAEPKPTILAAPLEESSALPLPDGGVLSFVRPRIVEGELDPSLRMEQLPSRQIWYHPPGAWAVADRVRCEALRGGVLPDSRGRWVATSRGEAIMFDIGDTWDVWRFDASTGGCGFERVGAVPQRAEDEHGESLAANGRVARAFVEGTSHGVRVHDPRGGAVSLELPGCTETTVPRWIDPTHLVLACSFDPASLVLDPGEDAEGEDADDEDADDEDADDEEADEAEPSSGAEPPSDPDDPSQADDADAPPPPPPRQVWIYLVDVASPSIAALPTSAFQPDASLVQLTPLGSGGPLELLVHDFAGLRLLGKARAKKSVDAFLAAPPADPAAPRPPFVAEDTALPVTALAAGELEVDLFGIETSGAYDVSPDGRWLVREVEPGTHVDPHGYDIALVALESGATLRVIASSDRAGHSDPQFSADGRHVLFESRYPVDIGASLESAAQILALPSR